MHPLSLVTVYNEIWYFHFYTNMKQDFTFCAKQNNFQFLNLDSSKNAQGPSEISFRAFYYLASFMQNNCANVCTMEMLPISHFELSKITFYLNVTLQNSHREVNSRSTTPWRPFFDPKEAIGSKAEGLIFKSDS